MDTTDQNRREEELRDFEGALVGLMALALLGGCQAPIDYELVQSCESCSIELREVWTAAPGNTDVNFSIAALPTRDGMLMAQFMTHRLIEYTADGSTARVVGEAGEGPGEYIGIQGLARLPDGRVVVAAHNRITLLDRDLSYSSSFTLNLSIMNQKFLVPNDSTLLVAWDSEESRTRFHVFDLDGSARTSFGPLDSSRDPTDLGQAPGAAFWSVPRSDPEARAFRLEKWDLERGMLVQVIEREPEWFRVWEPSDYSEAEDGPRTEPEPIGPSVSDVHEGDDGVLWVTTRVADPDYAEDPQRQSWSRFSDSILEALDSSTGEVIAVRRFDESLNGFTNSGGLLIVYAEDANGFPTLSVVEPRLVDPR